MIVKELDRPHLGRAINWTRLISLILSAIAVLGFWGWVAVLLKSC